MNIEYKIPETGDDELDERIDLLISESNDLYFKLSDRKLTDADMVLLKGTNVIDDYEEDCEYSGNQFQGGGEE